MNSKQWLDEQCKRAMMAEAMRLEEQAQIFLKMGFAVDELFCLERDLWGPKPERGVYPKMVQT